MTFRILLRDQLPECLRYLLMGRKQTGIGNDRVGIGAQIDRRYPPRKTPTNLNARYHRFPIHHLEPRTLFGNLREIGPVGSATQQHAKFCVFAPQFGVVAAQ